MNWARVVEQALSGEEEERRVAVNKLVERTTELRVALVTLATDPFPDKRAMREFAAKTLRRTA